MRRSIKSAIAVCVAAATSACAFSDPQTAPVAAQPKSTAVRNITSFSESLKCMDNLYASFGVNNIVITSAGLPDETGNVRAGTKDMLISAISRMSVRSKAFTFVDFDVTQADVLQLHSLVGFTDEFSVPRYYIRGAITQLDEGVIAESAGGGLAFPQAELGINKDQVVSVVTLDMNIGELAKLQIMPGIGASNSISVTRTGTGGDAGGTIGNAGIFFNISLNAAEGMAQSVRTLIELTAIETLGKLTRVPYWRCLQIEHTNPKMIAQARDWFDSMTQDEQIRFTQQALASQGYYAGEENGQLDTTTVGAISRYQADAGLIANGRIDFDLYQSLMTQDLALGVQPAKPEIIAASNIVPPLSIDLSTANGPSPTYQVGQKLKMRVAVSQDSYLYCYYQDARGSIARIYPNQFRPDPYVVGRQAFDLPSEVALYDIVFDQPGAQEEVACVASYKEVGMSVPENLKIADLTPVPVNTLDEVVNIYRRLDPAGAVDARLKIRVE